MLELNPKRLGVLYTLILFGKVNFTIVWIIFKYGQQVLILPKSDTVFPNLNDLTLIIAAILAGVPRQRA